MFRIVRRKKFVSVSPSPAIWGADNEHGPCPRHTIYFREQGKLQILRQVFNHMKQENRSERSCPKWKAHNVSEKSAINSSSLPIARYVVGVEVNSNIRKVCRN